jgi:hypothetical protein
LAYNKEGHGHPAAACPTFRKALMTYHEKDAFYFYIPGGFLHFLHLPSTYVLYSIAVQVFVKDEKGVTLAIGQTESGKDEEACSPKSMRAG